MAALGSGRKHNFGFINNLRESEVVILKTLLDWNHQASRANYRSIAAKCGISTSTVSAALYYLNRRGIVNRSTGRSWFIIPNIKDLLIQELGHTSTSEAKESAQPAEKNQNNPDHADPA